MKEVWCEPVRSLRTDIVTYEVNVLCVEPTVAHHAGKLTVWFNRVAHNSESENHFKYFLIYYARI